MPEDDAAHLTPVERYLRTNPDRLSTINFSRRLAAMPGLRVGSSAIEAMAKPYKNPVREGLVSQRMLYSSPAVEALTRVSTISSIGALASQRSWFSSSEFMALIRPSFASTERLSISKAISPDTTLSFRLPFVQQMLTQITTRTATQMLANYPELHRTVYKASQQLRDLENIEEASDSEDDGDNVEAIASFGLLVDEVTLEDAWHDIERVLLSDKQLRRSIKTGAKQLASQSKTKRRSMERVLIILVWVCTILGPWADGELKVDDAAAPIGALAAELATRLARADSGQLGPPRKNLLQKNGPRRRRHRRKRRR